MPGEVIFYFDLGMQAWRQHEARVSGMMSMIVDHRAEAALRYQQTAQVNEAKWQLPSSDWPSFDVTLASLKDAAERSIAEGKEIGVDLANIGHHLRVFSVLEAIVPASQVAESELPLATCPVAEADPAEELGLLPLETLPEEE